MDNEEYYRFNSGILYAFGGLMIGDESKCLKIKQQADRLKVRGWCRLTHDGHIEASMEGQEFQVKIMRYWVVNSFPQHGLLLTRLYAVPTLEHTDFTVKD